jgi:aminoglycoside 6'-N-acetyltransferase
MRHDDAEHDHRVRLRTRRLTLRPFRPDDVAAIEAFAHADAYLRYLGEGHPDPPALVTNNLGKDGAWVIELDDRVVGSIFLDDELACLLDPAVHGMGIATEAARAVISDGFDRRGYDEVVARAHPDNAASRRAIATLGFRARDDGTFRLDRSGWYAPRPRRSR